MMMILELPLTVPIPPLHGGMAATAIQGGYAYGINVHATGRDNLTTQAYQRLKTAQATLDQATIRRAYEEFLTALERQAEPLKSWVKIALGLQAAGSGGFGPLLQGTITSCGLNMKGAELIGRLWHFASTYQDPAAGGNQNRIEAERNNARRSVFAGLRDALEDDGHVVCNPGKLQRLAVSVLQGHLAGVNIDGVPLPAPAGAAAGGGGDGASPATPQATPTDIAQIVNSAWTRYKATLGRAVVTEADIEAFRQRFIIENTGLNEGAFNDTLNAIRFIEIDD